MDLLPMSTGLVRSLAETCDDLWLSNEPRELSHNMVVVNQLFFFVFVFFLFLLFLNLLFLFIHL